MAPPQCMRLDAVVSTAHQRVFAYLLRVNEECKLHAVLRVAGGWVRDTLLGIHSNDIDIAIETPHATTSSNAAAVTITGEAFARAVSACQAAEAGGVGRTVSVIRVNPALSKHIETATVCVCDVPVEFCALRCDDYSSESRIPQVHPGTPQEDALRRDYTVNALFYNLHTGLIEDYTSGLSDLAKRVLRCPLAPWETFMDDPLRLLRGIRFVSQLGMFNFRLDDSIMACVTDELLEMMLRKVSRERIGKEFVKMVTTAAPQRAIDLLLTTSLLDRVILVEVYLAPSSSKKQVNSRVERVVRVMQQVPDVAAAVDRVRALSHSLLPTLCIDAVRSGGGDSVTSWTETERLSAVLFILCLPFFRAMERPELDERLYALCINGLKLPVCTFHVLSRMIECYNVLVHHAVTLRALEGDTQEVMGDDTKLVLFKALYHLHDPHVTPFALQVVLRSYIFLDCVYKPRRDVCHENDRQAEALFSTDLMTASLESFERCWRVVTAQPHLIDAYTFDLPIKGNELRQLFHVQPKQIGSTLLRLRQQLILTPHLTRDDLITLLQSELHL